MSFQLEIEQKFAVWANLGVGDASVVLVDAQPNIRIIVTTVIVTGKIMAAQAIYVGDSSGTVKVLDLPASIPAVGQQEAVQLVNGISLTKGEALIIKPAAAGPSVHVIAEGYLLRS